MPEIKLRVLTDAHGGSREKLFPAGRLVVGRRGDCDFVVDPRHTLASGQHVAIDWVAGHLVIEDLDSTNGTSLNGQPLAGRVQLQPTDRFEVGPGGPELSAELVGASVDLVDTFDSGQYDLDQTMEQPPEADHDLEEPAPTEPFAPAPSGAVETPPSVFPGSASVTEKMQRPELPRRSPDSASLPRTGEKGSVGVHTMTEMVKAVAKRERRRAYAVGVLALGVGAAGFYFLRGDSADRRDVTTAPPEPSVASAKPAGEERAADQGFQSVLAAVGDSVYVVIRRSEQDGDRSRIREASSGTAWSIEAGALATNGHVADLFSDLEPGETLVARSNAQPPVDLRITGVRIHPGYAGFSSMIDRIRPFDTSTGEVLDLPPAYDVALLEIHPDDIASQAPPLTIASEERLYGLQAGQEIAFVGFPAEGLVRGGTDLTRPSAKTAVGSINRVIDPFFGRAESVSLAHCLEYNIEVVGGASGSPIVDSRGEVVGLINAGDVLSETVNGRVGTGGTSYGPRADTLRVLVDGTADAEWAELSPRIRERMLEIFRRGASESEEHAGSVGKEILRTVAADAGIHTEGDFRWTYEGQVKIEGAGATAAATLQVPAGDPGLRAIIAVAQGAPLALRLEGSGRGDRDKLVARAGNDTKASTVDARVLGLDVAGQSIRLDVRAEADEYFAPAEVAVYVLRLD